MRPAPARRWSSPRSGCCWAAAPTAARSGPARGRPGWRARCGSTRLPDVAAAGRRGRGRGRGRPRRPRPHGQRRGPLAGLRRRRLAARSAGWPSSPSRWWRSTASPTSTGCCDRRPSSAPSTGSPASRWPTGWRATGRSTTTLRATEQELDDVTTHARDRAREADLLRFGLDEVGAGRAAARRGRRARGRGGAARPRRLAAGGRRGRPRGAVQRPRPIPTRWARSPRPGPPSRESASTTPRRPSWPTGSPSCPTSWPTSAADVASYASGLETDPARLAAVSERRAALVALTRKYGETIDEVLAWQQRSAARLLELDGTDERIEQLDGRPRPADGRPDRRRRRSCRPRASEAASRLGGQVTAELADLAMPHARVEVVVTHVGTASAAPGATTSSSGWPPTSAATPARSPRGPPAASCRG